MEEIDQVIKRIMELDLNITSADAVGVATAYFRYLMYIKIIECVGVFLLLPGIGFTGALAIKYIMKAYYAMNKDELEWSMKARINMLNEDLKAFLTENLKQP